MNNFLFNMRYFLPLEGTYRFDKGCAGGEMNEKIPPCKLPDFSGSVLCNDCDDISECPFVPKKQPRKLR